MEGNKILEQVSAFWSKEKNNNRLLIVDETTPVIDPTTGPSDDRTLPLRLAGITFEMLSHNLASYGYALNVSRTEVDGVKTLKIIKTYYLEDNMKIVATTETNLDGNIVKTIEANEPLNKKFIKMMSYKAGTEVKAIYKEESV